MDIPDYYDLRHYAKILYDSNRNGKPFYRVGVSIDCGQMTISRYDYEEWDYNRKTGVVEINYSLDLLNTQKLASALRRFNSVTLVKEMKKRFGHKDSYIDFLDSFKKFCEENDIEYNYNVWY